MWRAWSLFFAFSALFSSPETKIACLATSLITFIWSLRLSLHLMKRLKGTAKEDRRYGEIIQENPKAWPLKSFFIFLMNAVLVSLLLLPQFVLIESATVPLSSALFVGLILMILSLIGEATADYQLASFIKKNPGKTCSLGLWAYSRHPNYFFEWLFWVGACLASVTAQYGYLSLSAPLLMFIFLNYFTGIALSEKNAEKRRPDFRAYKKRTSAFFPWP